MADVMPFGKRNWYPHMMPEDVAIWERFIEQFPDAYDHCQYDVLVGKAPDFVVNNPDPAMQKQANLYQYRIDVVGFKGDQIDIIELKPRAGTAVLGQINGYRHLYMRDYLPPETPKAVVITNELRPEMLELASVAGVTLVVV